MHLARRLHWLRIVALIGSLLSLLLTYTYATGKGSLCTLGDYFVCTLSETSYATVDGIFQFFSLTLGNTLPSASVGIPNSFIFLLGFLILLFFSYRFTSSSLSGLKITFYILAAYSVFLTYAETYVLYTLSLLGIVMSVLVFASLWLLVGLHTLEQKKSKQSPRKRR